MPGARAGWAPLRRHAADSQDRGHLWQGPFRLSVEGVTGDLAARTDYLVVGPRTGLFLLAVEPPGAAAKAFCARSDDAGKTLRLHGWMTGMSQPPADERWVMPSTIQVGQGHLLSAMRRRIDRRNWIDLYQSTDGGRTWSLVSKVAETAAPDQPFNGNPPALVRLADGRLCVTYGVRAAPFRMAARFSADLGRSWSDEVVLRQDGRNWDLGYPRTVQRPDGHLVTVYYFATPARRAQHIAATIWHPDSVSVVPGSGGR